MNTKASMDQPIASADADRFISTLLVDDSWMNDEERALFASALDLAPQLAALEKRCQAEGNVPRETIEAFRGRGLTRILQPRRYGGLQSSTLLLSRVVEELAMACTSSAWVLSVFGEHAWILAALPQAAQDAIWGADPLAVAASSLAPRATAQVVDGGYRLSGTYPFASGCKHAEWIILGAWVPVQGGKELRLMLVPMAQVEILDDWQTLGLRGTGSNTVALKDVFVPEHMTVRDADLQRGTPPGAGVHPDYALLRTPRMALAVYTQLPVTLALARRVLRHTCLTMRGRVSRGTTTLSDSQIVQLRIGEASADIEAAIAVAHQRHRHATRVVQSGARLSMTDMLACKRDSIWASRTARQGIERLIGVSSAEIVHDRNDLQMWFRDALTAGSHFGANWELGMVPFGQAQLGLAS